MKEKKLATNNHHTQTHAQFSLSDQNASNVKQATTGQINLIKQVIQAMQQNEQLFSNHYLATLSHDLRGPLNTIYTWAQVAEQKIDQSNSLLQRALAGIKKGVEQQTQLISEIQNRLEYGKLNSKMSVNVQANLQLVLNQVIFTAKNLIDSNIAMSHQLIANSPLIKIEHQKLWQLLWHIFYSFFWSAGATTVNATTNATTSTATINSSMVLNLSVINHKEYCQLNISPAQKTDNDQIISTTSNQFVQKIEQAKLLAAANQASFSLNLIEPNQFMINLSLPI